MTATPSPVTGASTTPVSYALTGLTPNTKYYFRVKAVSTGSAFTTYGAVKTFTTLPAPTATTVAASGVTATGATLNGTVNNENNPSTTVTFCYKATTTISSTCTGATSVTATQSPVTGSSATPVSYALTGLTPNTEYFFRVEAVGGGATVYSSTVLNFTTPHGAPTATTTAATSITATAATLNGTVNNENNTSTAVTFCYKATPTFATCTGATSVTATPATATGASTTPVSYSLTGLTPNTKYFFQVKAVSTGSAFTTYGSVLTFTTLPAPTATTVAASGVTATGATLNGTVNNENNPSTTVTLCYKATTTISATCTGATSVTATQSPVTGSSATPVSYALTGLSPNTKYFFRVEAVGGGATVYSSTVLNFTTTHEAPTATTDAATGVTATGATLNGTVNNENNTSTAVTFCYKATTTISSTCTGATSVTATQSPVTGGSATPVSYALTGLAPNTEYFFRVEAVSTGNAFTVYSSTVLNFTTPHEPRSPQPQRRPASRPPVPPSTAQSTTRTTPRARSPSATRQRRPSHRHAPGPPR